MADYLATQNEINMYLINQEYTGQIQQKLYDWAIASGGNGSFNRAFIDAVNLVAGTSHTHYNNAYLEFRCNIVPNNLTSGGGSGGCTEWSATNKSAFIEVEQAGDLSISTIDPAVGTWSSVITNVSVSSGKWYSEFSATSSALTLLGVCTQDFQPTVENHYPGSSSSASQHSVGWYGSGSLYRNLPAVSGVISAGAYSTDNVESVLLDLDSTPPRVIFWRDGVEVTSQDLPEGKSWFMGAAHRSQSVTANFRGDTTEFVYDPPVGYTAGFGECPE